MDIAGNLTSTSENLTLAEANVEVAEGIDTGNLVIESLQDESSSSSKSNSKWVNNHNPSGQTDCTAESCPQGRLQGV